MNAKGQNITRNMATAIANQKDLTDTIVGPKAVAPKDEELDGFLKDMPLTDDTTCGLGCIRGDFLQRFANKKVFVLLYGLVGCCYSSSYSYFNGSITTLEKRFKIPTKTTGLISVGNDITTLLVSVMLSYYAGRGHRPRWIAFGIYCVALFCFMTALPHFIYGPGEDSLMLTMEYSRIDWSMQNASTVSENIHNKMLCDEDSESECVVGEGSLIPQIILFSAQLISGIGGTLYFTLGFSYMDDNIKKSKSPAIISLSYFIRTLGPAIGYALVSACLKLYIDPTLTPVIQNTDPRWLGAWWLGWIILGVLLMFFGSILALLPKTLPRAAARKEFIRQKSKDHRVEDDKPSFKDLMETLKRLIKNKTYTYNHLSSIFYIFGYLPYWTFMPKYIETLYRQSASVSSLATGTVGLVFSAIGILLSGVVVQHFKPKARYMAAWNVLVGLISLVGIIGYAFLGCDAIDDQMPIYANGQIHTDLQCNSGCNCDYVKYSPVCAMDYSQTFISPCHAGCTDELRTDSGKKIYTNCACIEPSSNVTTRLVDMLKNETLADTLSAEGVAVSGPCPVDCQRIFYIFLVIVCILKLTGATGRVTNFLVCVRCVEERDKAISLGIGLTAMSFFAFIPSPIIYGYIMDSACLVWGKTCSGTGNCWLYNAETLRTRLNYVSAMFVALGTVFDILVWVAVKNLNIFDENIELEGDPGEEVKAQENSKVENVDKEAADEEELEKLNSVDNGEQKSENKHTLCVNKHISIPED